jgi:hypothetical protein
MLNYVVKNIIYNKWDQPQSVNKHEFSRLVNNKPIFIQKQRQRNFHNQLKFISTRGTQTELTDRPFRLLCEVVYFSTVIGIPIRVTTVLLFSPTSFISYESDFMQGPLKKKETKLVV